VILFAVTALAMMTLVSAIALFAAEDIAGMLKVKLQ
jgi:hypothetical protein